MHFCPARAERGLADEATQNVRPKWALDCALIRKRSIRFMRSASNTLDGRPPEVPPRAIGQGITFAGCCAGHDLCRRAARANERGDQHCQHDATIEPGLRHLVRGGVAASVARLARRGHARHSRLHDCFHRRRGARAAVARFWLDLAPRCCGRGQRPPVKIGGGMEPPDPGSGLAAVGRGSGIWMDARPGQPSGISWPCEPRA
jgi:hypothetical protein